MVKRIADRPWLMLGSGLTLGLVVGLGMLVSALLGARFGSQAETPILPLHAMATHGTDSMAIATCPIDQDMEALVTLDFITGELQVSALQMRNAKFILRGKYNVLGDLQVEKGKKANFLLVTGASNYVKGSDNLQPAISTVYVANANNGLVAAYGLRFNRTAYQAGTNSPIDIVLLDGLRGKAFVE